MNEIPIARVEQILAGIRATRIMVVGDVMVDRYVWGVVSRISPEAPVPVVEVNQETERLGGAANVANNIVALGAACSVFGVVGQDRDGVRLRKTMEEVGIDASWLVVDSTRPTTVKTRVIAHNQQVVRTDREHKAEVSGRVAASLADCVMSAVDGFDAIIVSDYGKGVITRALLKAMIPAARSCGKIVSVDPKETHFKQYKRVTLITPNQYEAASAMGTRISDEESLMEVGWQIIDLLEPDALLITRGEKGMSLFEKSRNYSYFPTVARQVYDVTGAGDTVICAFTLALAAGATMSESAQMSNHAAGIVIREIGTAAASPDEIIASFRDLAGHSAQT